MRYYLQDGREYIGNCMLWWKAGNRGYTTSLEEAHVFSEQERCNTAVRNSDIFWEKPYIDGLTAPTVDFQKVDQNKARTLK